ncbi:hypothetical protein BXZ70DRAFT_307767 [Cristinia sonorae]|uniref:Uncharacterized protein n=1 Tax=Cristinia sonorae TaxID=1940300 RepID=A0A8K0XNQ9_9AGAR|nr:hypothetical protein BXZ70DRAFT_307767 [Cristinia sonorae]
MNRLRRTSASTCAPSQKRCVSPIQCDEPMDGQLHTYFPCSVFLVCTLSHSSMMQVHDGSRTRVLAKVVCRSFPSSISKCMGAFLLFTNSLSTPHICCIPSTDLFVTFILSYCLIHSCLAVSVVFSALSVPLALLLLVLYPPSYTLQDRSDTADVLELDHPPR